VAERERLICQSDALAEGGCGIRFEVQAQGETMPAFAVRYAGRVYGYVNRCGHIPVELDWQPGEFFDYSRIYLVCSTHGALYHPETGACVTGRCNGRGLICLPLIERDGAIYLKEVHNG
jgi:nitrite reductase/ring-hydroxylating ferredoxin subunit